MNHRREFVLIASAFLIVNVWPAAYAGQPTKVDSRAPARTDGSSKRQFVRQDEMRHRADAHAHGSKGVPLGAWGGEHISMEVMERSATLEFDCAHATIPRRISLDRRGRFDVSGTYVEEHGGPVRAGEQSGGDAARFTGRVIGQTMKLTVARGNTGKITGTFTLAHGREPSLVKCR